MMTSFFKIQFISDVLNFSFKVTHIHIHIRIFVLYFSLSGMLLFLQLPLLSPEVKPDVPGALLVLCPLEPCLSVPE